MKTKQGYGNKLNSLISKNSRAQEVNEGVRGTKGILPKSIAGNTPDILRRVAAEGCVLLKNTGILPLKKNTAVSVFGRVQYDYFFVGKGSGGDVRSPYEISLIEGLRNCQNIKINRPLAAVYEAWCSRGMNVPKSGTWGHWPQHYAEMPISNLEVSRAANHSEAAIVAIGRSCGESQDASARLGSYYLTKRERHMLNVVTNYFSEVIVVINSGNIIDLSWLNEYGDKIGAVLMAWQGGMESGNAIADVISGKVNPSGRLTSTVANSYEDYPSADNFGGRRFNNYVEDIYVGYRYFETFSPESVQFPFGFGLSYTSFGISLIEAKRKGRDLIFKVNVRNTGSASGKEVVQIYASSPKGGLDKPSRVLVAFGKTGILRPGEDEVMELTASLKKIASYDDSGKSGYKYAFVLEKGSFTFYLGNNVRDAAPVWRFQIPETMVLQRLEPVMALSPDKIFQRLVAAPRENIVEKAFEKIPEADYSLRDRILTRIPDLLPQPDGEKIVFSQVLKRERMLREFTAQLSLQELEDLSRGDGTMDSPLGAKGNAGCLGGVTESLRERGIPPITVVDGPAGIRLKCSCSLLPCATTLASTWDTVLMEGVHSHLAREMKKNDAHLLLAPGMNIQRNPLGGRNFEYYSEDPLLTGKMAAAAVNGLQSNGVAACPKHFACNDQEYFRTYRDSRLSQRALREIYLRGFEICVKESHPVSIMSSYNRINGVWSHYNYDLCTTVLRDEWGFDGAVLTDWWMRYAKSPEFSAIRGDAYRVRAQVDVLMPGGKNRTSKTAAADDSVYNAVHSIDGLTRAELQRNALNVLGCIVRIKQKPEFARRSQTRKESLPKSSNHVSRSKRGRGKNRYSVAEKILNQGETAVQPKSREEHPVNVQSKADAHTQSFDRPAVVKENAEKGKLQSDKASLKSSNGEGQPEHSGKNNKMPTTAEIDSRTKRINMGKHRKTKPPM